MRLVTGDECGLLKEVIPELGRKKKDPKALIQPHGAMIDISTTGMSRVDPKEPQTRDRGVVDMVWMQTQMQMHQTGEEDFGSSFSVLRKNGSVDVWSYTNSKTEMTKKSFGQYSLSHTTPNNLFGTKDSCRPLGLGYFREQNRLVAGDMLGNIVVLDMDTDSSNSKGNEGKCNVVQTYNSYTASKGSNRTTISYTPGKMENVQLATAIAFDVHRGRVAVGGREREVCLTDLSTGKLVFKTKNTPPDPQTLLQQPVWPTAIRFLGENGTSNSSSSSGSSNGNGNGSSNLMAVGTAYKQIRLYDVRENSTTRRPTSLTPEGLFEYRVTCLCQVSDHELVVGDASGDIHTVDLRRLVRNRHSKAGANRDLARYAGPSGSVRQLSKHPTLPRLVAVGLDRMVRVYDTNTRKQLDCVYLKQRLNSVLVHPCEGGATSDDEREDDEYGDYDYDYDSDDVDMDQDDVVRDYVDSEDEKQDDDDGDDDGDDESERNDSAVESPEDEDGDEDSELQEEDGSSGNEEDGSGEEMSDSNSGDRDEDSEEEEEDDDDEEEEEEEEEEQRQQKKRRRRGYT